MSLYKIISKNIFNYYLVCLIVGFVFISTIPKVFGLTENAISVPYRLFILVFSLIVIYKSIRYYQNLISFKYFLPFFFFWFLYSIRLFYDLLLDPIVLHTQKSTSDYLLFAYGVVFLPTLALLLSIQLNRIDYKKVFWSVYFILLGCLFSSYLFRISTGATGRSAGDLSIGILLFGQYGTTLTILSFYALLYLKTNYILKLISYLGIIIGFLSVLISASKSPFLALIIVLLILFSYRIGFFKTLLFFFIASIFFSGILISFLSDLSTNLDSNFFRRLVNTIEKGGDDSREILYNYGIESFVNNPFFGESFLIQKGAYIGSYPHNIIIEAFMSLGFLGGFLIIFLIFKALFNSFLNLKYQTSVAWVGLLFIQFLIFSMFSNNIFSNDLFWFFLVMMFFYNKTEVYKFK